MRIKKALGTYQDIVIRFLAVLGGGLVVASQSKAARPEFFLYAGQFIYEYMEPVYFRKEEILLSTLEEYGFPPDEGPVGKMRHGRQKSRELLRMLLEAARSWKAGDPDGRTDTIWATSEYTSLMRQHFDLLKNLIYPLLEQSITADDEQKLAARIYPRGTGETGSLSSARYLKIIESMEEEVSDWR